jgi:hypothetical protein
LYWFENRLLTYWFMSEVLPTLLTYPRRSSKPRVLPRCESGQVAAWDKSSGSVASSGGGRSGQESVRRIAREMHRWEREQ